MKTGRRAAVLAAVVGVVAVGVVVRGEASIAITPDMDLADAVAAAPAGATLVLAPGTYRGPVEVTRPLAIEGEGAAIVAPVDADAVLAVSADDVRVAGVSIRGGSTGVLVRDADGVVIEEVSVTGSDLHGIEIVDASATITAASVADLRHEMAQGIEIRNSDGRPRTVVADTKVRGGQEGIVTHVSEVIFENNFVTDTTMRGIVVTEMSDGWVTGNTVMSAFGTGFYCGDMSRCQFKDNVADSVAAGSGGNSAAGWGLVVQYHARASSSSDSFVGAAGSILESIDGRMVSRSPLDPASPRVLVAPGALSLAVAAVVAFFGCLIARRIPLRGRAVRGSMVLFGVAFLGVFLVQSFHMFEHALQVYRVHVDLVPSRGGLAGPGVDVEWVHLAYNAGLMLFLVIAAMQWDRWPGRTPLVGAVLIEGWHTLEHVAKVIQHVVTGAKVNPGLVGGYFDLVWFHFTLNLAVYALCVIATAGAVRALLPMLQDRAKRPVTV
ncbi:MAG: right-handed parallel beta-helix repeat-containing protein [Actinobacteria bacterium]|nr:right-handed parallel beta-helix repeat-containing protein [Actinomycetota bacterium]